MTTDRSPIEELDLELEPITTLTDFSKRYQLKPEEEAYLARSGLSVAQLVDESGCETHMFSKRPCTPAVAATIESALRIEREIKAYYTTYGCKWKQTHNWPEFRRHYGIHAPKHCISLVAESYTLRTAVSYGYGEIVDGPYFKKYAEFNPFGYEAFVKILQYEKTFRNFVRSAPQVIPSDASSSSSTGKIKEESEFEKVFKELRAEREAMLRPVVESSKQTYSFFPEDKRESKENKSEAPRSGLANTSSR